MKTLEERLWQALSLDWLTGDQYPAEEVREKIHAALQLARREGFVKGQGEPEMLARDAYPLTRKMEVPREESDPTRGAGSVTWLVRPDGVLVRQEPFGYTETAAVFVTRCGPHAFSAERCRLWADLLDNPTKVEEQPIREDEAL